jgi:uncharacterized protein (TIGR02466 family)
LFSGDILVIQDFFSVPIYQTKVEPMLYDKVQEELSFAYENSSFSMKPGWGSTHYLSDTSFSKSFIKSFNLQYFPREIKRHLGIYLDMIGFSSSTKFKPGMKKEIVSSWFSKFEKGCFAHIHNHGSSDISGVYYFKVPNGGSELFFRNPITHLDSSLVYEHLGSGIDIAPSEGDILLFPSWLQHGVKTNMTDDTRVSVSFNICLERPELI